MTTQDREAISPPLETEGAKEPYTKFEEGQTATETLDRFLKEREAAK
jgi:hypothetical protein